MANMEQKANTLSKLENDIINQIEYYFGDLNLHRDSFLKAKIAKNRQGWVSISFLLRFKRLAKLSRNVDEIVNALIKSDKGLLQISDDKKKIRRHPDRPLSIMDEEKANEVYSRTAFANGFPINTKMSDLIEYFSSYDKVENIIMRKYFFNGLKTQKFKGSIFVTFSKKEQCEEFINKKKVLYKKCEIIREWQQEYNAQIKLPKGKLIHFNVKNSKQLTREIISENFAKLGVRIRYIAYNRGNESGYIRLVNSAKEILDAIGNKLQINDTELTLKLIEGDEETKVLANIFFCLY